MTQPVIALALTIFLQAATPLAPDSAASPDDYVARFCAALDELDRGAYVVAAAGFVAAGELAPDAPVWCAHAAVALAHAGERAEAWRRFEDALRRGYPPSDLAALHPLGAEVTRAAGAQTAGVDAVAETSVTVARSGLQQVPGDARGVTRAARGPQRLDPAAWRESQADTVLAWKDEQRQVRLALHALDADRPQRVATKALPESDIVGTWIDADGTTTPIRRTAPLWRAEGGATLNVDALQPWLASAATAASGGLGVDGADVARAVRSGLWLRGGLAAEDRPECCGLNLASADAHGTTVHVRCGEDVRELDLARFGRAAAPAATPSFDARGTAAKRRSPRGLAPVDDPSVLNRVRTLVGAAFDERVGALRFEGVVGRVDSPLLALRNRPDDPEDPRAFRPVVILAPDGGSILHELDLNAVFDDALALLELEVGYGAPLYDAATERLVLPLNVDVVVAAIDTAHWRLAWRTPWVSNSGGVRSVSVAAGGLLATTPQSAWVGDVLDLRTGRPRLRGDELGLWGFAAAGDGAVIVGQGLDSLYVFDANALGALDSDAAPPEPLCEVTLVDDTWAAVAVDGTFALSPRALEGASVLLESGLVDAASVAPWLLDPLHVRTLRGDVDHALRRVPRSLARDLASALGHPQGDLIGDYVPRFLAALALLDASEDGDSSAARAAAEGFERAGETAPHAPVWRVHAGVARARAGERDAALAHFAAALEQGYPVDDLVALGGLDVDLARQAATRARSLDASTADRSRWRTLVGRGPREVPYGAWAWDHGDLFELRASSSPRDDGVPLHEFLDRDTLAVVARLSPPLTESLGWAIAPDGTRTTLGTPSPSWRGPAGERLEQARFRQLTGDHVGRRYDILPRGLRTGVWLEASKRVTGAWRGAAARSLRLEFDGVESSVEIDIDRWCRTLRPPSNATPAPRGPSGGRLMRVEDSALTARAFELAGLEQTSHASDPFGDAREAWRLPDELGLIVFTNAYWQEHFGRLFVLDLDATRIVGRINTPLAHRPSWASFGAPLCAVVPGVDPESGRRKCLLLSASTVPDLVLRIDLDTFAMAWVYEGGSHNGWPRELSAYGDRVVCHGGHTHAAVLDLATGELVYDAYVAGLSGLDGVFAGTQPVEGWFGVGSGSVVVLASETFAPLAELWLHGDALVVAATDGTFLMDAVAVAEAYVDVDGRRVPARLVAPWMLDPLHVRSLQRDSDLTPRRFPIR